MKIEEIKNIIQNPYLEFKEELERRTSGRSGLLAEVEDYLNCTPGKQLRPMLVLLSAKACGHLTQGHSLLAAAMELLHNATLMHDDVVDESEERRGKASVRGHWGNQVAVLCGDYYLAQCMAVLQQVGSRSASDIVAKTVMTMCQGELDQLYWTKSGGTSKETYLEVIGGKTASLMSACCELGAVSLGENVDKEQPYRALLRDFGYEYGLVFQMRDDMADEGNMHDIHLPEDVDMKEVIEEHLVKAEGLLEQLPDSDAKTAMKAMLELKIER